MKRGRKCKYETHVKPYFPQIKAWLQTMTEKQIAEKLGVAYSSWNQYKLDYSEFSEFIKKGRHDLVIELKSALIKKAKGFKYKEKKEIYTAISMEEDLYAMLLERGFSTDDLTKMRWVRTEITEKQSLPDVAAANLLLKNYDRDNWANDPQALEIRRHELELQERRIDAAEW